MEIPNGFSTSYEVNGILLGRGCNHTSPSERKMPVIHGPTHVARLEFPHETGLILRCAGKAGNPSRPRRGIASPVAIRRGEGAQMHIWTPYL